MRDGSPDAQGSARPPGPLPHRARQPAASRRSPRPTATARSGSSSATTPPRPKRDQAQRTNSVDRIDHRDSQRIETQRAEGHQPTRGRRRTPRPNARCATTRPSARYLRRHPDGPAPDRPRQDRRRGAPRRQVPDLHLRPRTSPPKTSRSATRTCSKPNAASATSRPPSQLRPVFHRLEHRIRAHVLLCWLALLLIRIAERQTEQTWRRIATRARPHPPRHPHRPDRHDRPNHRADRHPTRAVRRDRRSPPPPRITALEPA